MMKIWIPKNREDLKKHLSDPLFKNAYFLMLSSITSAGSGFFFWLIVARFYSAEDVGLASAIISAMGLIGMLSLLGFDVSLVRFLPEREDKAEIINTCMTISFMISISLAIIFVAGVELFSPSLAILKDNWVLLLLFVIYTSVIPLTGLQREGIFAGFRKTEYSFVQTLVTVARIGIVPFLTAFGAVGIYASFGLTPLLAFIVGIFLTSRILDYRPVPAVRREVLNDILHFSFGNYLARIFEMLPTFILPIMVINVLGAEANAYFYIAWQISMLLLTIPRFTSISLLAEGSYNSEELGRDVRRAFKFVFILLGVAIIGIFLFGKYLLWIFGKEYAMNSFEVLSVLVLGSVPFAINTLYASVMRVKREVKPVIGVYGGMASVTVSVSYLLVQKVGLVGVGIGWLVGNLVVAGGVGVGLRFSGK